jgi:hypothetical protein
MDTPTTKQFRVGETKAIIADAESLLDRIDKHRAYLSDPALREAHRADCRDNDVVLANLALAGGYIEQTKHQLGIALKLTDTPDPVKPVETPSEPETAEP